MTHSILGSIVFQW